MDLGYEGPPDPPDDGPLDVDGNPVMLREMLGNLIDNAIAHRTAAACSARARQARGALVHLEVEDTGPGIGRRTRRVVERFYRILGREGDGSGLEPRSCARSPQHGGTRRSTITSTSTHRASPARSCASACRWPNRPD